VTCADFACGEHVDDCGGSLDCGPCPFCGDGVCDETETCRVGGCETDCCVCEADSCDDGNDSTKDECFISPTAPLSKEGLEQECTDPAEGGPWCCHTRAICDDGNKCTKDIPILDENGEPSCAYEPDPMYEGTTCAGGEGICSTGVCLTCGVPSAPPASNPWNYCCGGVGGTCSDGVECKTVGTMGTAGKCFI
jgi:hypothetical protein